MILFHYTNNRKTERLKERKEEGRKEGRTKRLMLGRVERRKI